MFGRRQCFAAVSSVALVLLSVSVIESRTTAYYGSISSLSDNERDRGIELYEKGDTVGAVKALQAFVKKQKNDIRAWHYLGLALSRNGKTNDARKAHEKAAKIGERLIEVSANGINAPRDLLSRIAPIKNELIVAAVSADKYLELSSRPSRSKISEWHERAEHLRDFLVVLEELKEEDILVPAEVTTKARILSKPAPSYTEEARKNQVTGTVILAMIFSADGRIRGIIPITSLPDGLTGTSIAAARRIKFVPATKDGKPVSQFIRVEYNFNIY